MKNKNLPGLITILLFLVTGCIALSIWTDRNHGMRARIVNAMADEKQIASALKQRAAETGGVTNIDNSFVYRTIFGALRLNYGPDRTNSQGEILDIWKMPFQIEVKPPANFVVHSAGPNQKFGDADGIIFNSLSNDFVKP
jgi:hypothetical protein